ncbi:hypothetical protein HOD08_05345, partial [bacterium]|nr:hypothetical protein [bacterium]
MTKKILIALCTLSLFQNTSTEPPTKTVRFANPIAMAIPEKALAPQVTTKQIDSAIKSFISEVTSWYEATQSAVEGDMDSLKEKSEISKAMAGLWKFHPDNPTDRSPELTYGPKKKQGTINLQNLKPSVYESINERYEGNVKRWFTDEIANFYRWQNRIKELGEEEAAKQLKNIYNAIGKELPNLLSTRSKIQTGNPLTIDEATRAVRIVNETILRTSIHKQVKISRKIVDLVLETLGLDGKPKSEQSAEKLRRLFPAKNGFQDGVEIAKLELKKYKLAIEATKFQKIIEDIDIKKSEAPGLQNKGEITKRKSKKDKLAIEVTRLQKIIKEIDFKESEAQGVWKQIIEFTAENPAEKSSDFHKAIDSARRAEAALFMHNRLLLGRSAAGQKSPIELIKTGTQEGMVEMQTDAIEYLKSWRREAKKAKEFMNSYRIQLAKIEAEEAEAKKARAK